MFVRAILLLVLLTIVGGAAFLVFWDVPPPTQRIDLEIPDEQLSK